MNEIGKTGVDYKFADTAFKYIFQSSEGISNLLAFLGMESDQTEIEQNFIKSTLFESRENDLSFLLRHTYYYFIEHQSSICPNMPFRLLLYVVEGLQDIARREMKQMKQEMSEKQAKRVSRENNTANGSSEIMLLYSNHLISLPEIKCYNFLTGVVSAKKVSQDIWMDMRLSDAYRLEEGRKADSYDLELVVHCLDLRITEEEAEKFYDCHTVPQRFGSLNFEIIQYAMLVGAYKGICKNRKCSITSRQAQMVIRDILSWYNKNGYLQRILNNKEGTNMIYDMLTREDLYKMRAMAEGWEEGLEEGLEKGLQKGLEEGLEKGLERGREEGLEKGLKRGLQEGREEGKRRGIFAMLSLLYELNMNENKIVSELMTRFSMTEEEVCSYIQEYGAN